MMKSANFYVLWFIYFIGAGVGLMVISSIAGMAKKSMPNAAFLAVAIMAIGNAGGRIIAGILSDKIGRNYTVLLMLLFQAVLMLAAIPLVGAGHPSAILMLLAGNVYRIQLWVKPVPVPVFRQGSVGAQVVRH